MMRAWLRPALRAVVILGLVGVAWCAVAKQTAETIDPTMLAMQGSNMPASEAAKLEKQLKAHPRDLSARTKLLGYYSLRRFRSASDKATRAKHILWIIKNEPAAEVAGTPELYLNPVLDGNDYSTARTLWLKQAKLHKKNATVLGNAASFLLLSDSRQAEALLLQAKALQPKNPHWPEKLAQLYELRYDYLTGDARRPIAVKAFVQLQEAYVLSTEQDKVHLLSDLAKTAFEAGESAKAESYAKQAIASGDELSGIFDGNIVLGRLALQAGDTGKAKEYLLAAGHAPSSPPRATFGPNMLLAKELLDKGEREAVLQYLDLCGAFWDSGKDTLKEWKATIRAGGTPDFGANLVY
jgi:hypothetical protein